VQNRLLARDNLAKHRALHDGSCFFCDENVTVPHLFIECVVAKHVWLMVMRFLLGIIYGLLVTPLLLLLSYCPYEKKSK
jgi:hypothetical protein